MNHLFLPMKSVGGAAGLLGLNWVCLALGLAGLAVLFWGLWRAAAFTVARPQPEPSSPPAVPEDPEPGKPALLSEFLRK
jgi:hypothetical protein